MNNIQPGSVVQLKSGGPYMTVAKLYDTDRGPRAQCDWFEGTKAQYNSYPLTSLNVKEEDPSSASGAVAGLSGEDPSASWMR